MMIKKKKSNPILYLIKLEINKKKKNKKTDRKFKKRFFFFFVGMWVSPHFQKKHKPCFFLIDCL